VTGEPGGSGDGAGESDGVGSAGSPDGAGDGESTGGVLLDATLAVLPLLGTAAVGSALGARILPWATVAGGVGTLALEAVLGRRHGQVRAAWARPGVKAATVLGGIGWGAATVWVVPSQAASAIGGGLVAYLALLVAVRTGVLPPPRAW